MDPNEEHHSTTKETAAQQRLNKQAKMWYLRRIQIGNTKLPFSAVTVAIILFSIYYLVSNWSGGGGGANSGVFCEASHILLSDHSEAAQATLNEYKEKIKDDPELFAKHARKFSACSSKNNGGNMVSGYGQGFVCVVCCCCCFSAIDADNCRTDPGENGVVDLYVLLYPPKAALYSLTFLSIIFRILTG
jgi:hypothetical protein